MDEIVYSVTCSNDWETEFSVRRIKGFKYDVIKDDASSKIYFPQVFEEVQDAIDFVDTLQEVFEEGYYQGVNDNY